MVIRDDRGCTTSSRKADQYLHTGQEIRDRHQHAPDAVLYNCPDCGRSHFVTVDACPDADTAAKETAMVGRKAA